MQSVRIQLSRKKGFKLQEYSKSINGLEAVKCDRSTRWGNPFKVEPRRSLMLRKTYYGIYLPTGAYCEFDTKEEANQRACFKFEELIKENDKELDKILKEDGIDLNYSFGKNKYCVFDVDNKFCYFQKDYEWLRLTTYFIQYFLKGKNLACWCKENETCHCDTLLRIIKDYKNI